jgi:hypothetical protein
MNFLFAAEQDLELQIGAISLRVVAIASAIVIILILYAALAKSRSHIVFGSIVVTVLAASIFLIGSTIYLNQISVSKGPVHWHADIEIWNCGEELDLLDPQGFLSNKIGTPTLHEHNDKRIHLEGVVVETRDASLGKFFQVIGGDLTKNSLIVPTNDGKQSLISGQQCGDQPAEMQTFLYRVDESGDTYTQTKLADPAAHIIKDDSQVPPGDCVIFEFDQPKQKTDKKCTSWKVAEDLGKIKESTL